MSYSWKHYYDTVKYFSLGLVSMGFKKDDNLAIIGENKPEWCYAELAAQVAGGAAAGIFTDCVADEVKFFVNHSESVFVVASDQEQVDKLLAIKDEIPRVKRVIYWKDKGLWKYDDPILIRFGDVVEIGRDYEKSHSDLFDKNVDAGDGEDIGVICYTSGTTGTPKGAMLSQRWLVEASREWSIRDGWYGKGCEYLSFIPGAWATEQAIGIGGALIGNLKVSFPEEPDTVQNDLREIGPDLLMYGARIWELESRSIQAKIMDTTWFRRSVYRLCMSIGLKVVDKMCNKENINFLWRFLNFLAYHTAFRQLRDNVGLTNADVAYSTGSALSPDIIRYFLALGIEIRLIYGSTELGPVSIPVKDEIRPETSGRVVPWAEVKLSDEGEILVKSRHMYSGYYNNPEATRDKLIDGWYQSGDFGHIDEDGHLIVIDRMEDLKPLAGGKQFSPQYTEIRLRFSPFIKDVLVVGGENREYVAALVNIDVENVGRFAEKNHIAYTTFTDLSQKPEIIELVRKEMEHVNRTLPNYARLKRFSNLNREFDADEAELTRTRKLRRTFVEDRYSDMIDAIYSDSKEFEAEATVTYRDGRKGSIKTIIKLTDVEG
jgi:long-chain acyl-CoA synthetase